MVATSGAAAAAEFSGGVTPGRFQCRAQQVRPGSGGMDTGPAELDRVHLVDRCAVANHP
jgi:hypothetical protein